MGDISMDEYGCVAISPLWLGGTEQQNSLFCVHNCPEVEGATELNPDGLMLGGWEAARPKVTEPQTSLGRTPTPTPTLPQPQPQPYPNPDPTTPTPTPTPPQTQPEP